MDSKKKINPYLMVLYSFKFMAGLFLFLYYPVLGKLIVQMWFMLISMSIYIFIRHTDQYNKSNLLVFLTYSLLGASVLILLSILSFEIFNVGIFKDKWEEQFLLSAAVSLSLTVFLGLIFNKNRTPVRIAGLVFIIIPLIPIVLVPSGFFPEIRTPGSGLNYFSLSMYSLSAVTLLISFILYSIYGVHENRTMFRQIAYAAVLKAFVFMIHYPTIKFGGLWLAASLFLDAASSYKMFKGVVLEGILSPLKKLKDTEMRLRREQIFYQETLAGVQDGIFTYYDDRDELFVSSVWEDITGYKAENHIIPGPELCELLGLDDFNRVTNIMRQAIQTGAYVREELEMKHRDGHHIWVLIRGRKGRNAEDKPCFIGIITEVSQRKNIEQELIQAKEKAEESDRLKTSFLANISHEIRTPLNVILGFSGLLLKDLPEREQREEKQKYLELVRQSSNQLISIISDIIEISRIQNEVITLKTQNIPVADLFKNLKTVYRKLMDDRGKKEIRLSWTIPEGVDSDISIETDIERFHQIWQNLLNNAMKFIEFGQISFGISSIDHEKNRITFFVEDTGPGIGRGKDQLIFERFRQGEEGFDRRYGGSGLGLTITRDLLKLMGGRIELDRSYTMGARFMFTLPENPRD